MAEPGEDPHLVTRLLQEAGEGRDGASEELMSLVYAQLRRIAQSRMNSERDGHSLQATELVHEAYLKLAGKIESWKWSDRAHFYRVAAEAMRQILIDYARARNSVKRGSGQAHLVLDVLDLAKDPDPDAILAMDEAVQQLESEDEKLGQIVRLRFYAGLNVEETAGALEMSKRSVTRYWTFARAWLYEKLKKG